MLSKKLIRLFIMWSIFALSLTACSITNPVLNHSGGNYRSITDDKLLNESLSMAIEEISINLNLNKKFLIVQTIKNPTNEYIADRLFEKLYNDGYTVGKSDFSPSNSNNTFDKFLIFYPTVYGVENYQTRPTLLGAMTIIFTPLFFHSDRKASVVIHCRLVDKKTMAIEWIKDFSGNSSMRLY